MEQREPEGQMLFCLGNVTYLLDGTASNIITSTLCYSSSKIWLLSNMQQTIIALLLFVLLVLKNATCT